MAYTFEELAIWFPGKSYPVAKVKLLVTQEDGRTLYGEGEITSFNMASNEFSGQFRQQFNDRTRQLTYGPPSTSSGQYSQTFDVNEGVDLVNFIFKKLAANQFELRQTLLRWGNVQIVVALTKTQQAKMYTGWGTTIARGSGLALNALSINDAFETPG